MNSTLDDTLTYWPLVVYFGAALLLVGSMVGGSWLLGQRHKDRATGEPYESGIPVTGSARLRFPASFYLIAMFFVVFDVESVFLFSWAVAAKEVGWAGYLEMVIFVGILLAALAYLWRAGALDHSYRVEQVSHLFNPASHGIDARETGEIQRDRGRPVLGRDAQNGQPEAGSTMK